MPLSKEQVESKNSLLSPSDLSRIEKEGVAFRIMQSESEPESGVMSGDAIALYHQDSFPDQPEARVAAFRQAVEESPAEISLAHFPPFTLKKAVQKILTGESIENSGFIQTAPPMAILRLIPVFASAEGRDRFPHPYDTEEHTPYHPFGKVGGRVLSPETYCSRVKIQPEDFPPAKPDTDPETYLKETLANAIERTLKEISKKIKEEEENEGKGPDPETLKKYRSYWKRIVEGASIACNHLIEEYRQNISSLKKLQQMVELYLGEYPESISGITKTINLKQRIASLQMTLEFAKISNVFDTAVIVNDGEAKECSLLSLEVKEKQAPFYGDPPYYVLEAFDKEEKVNISWGIDGSNTEHLPVIRLRNKNKQVSEFAFTIDIHPTTDGIMIQGKRDDVLQGLANTNPAPINELLDQIEQRISVLEEQKEKEKKEKDLQKQQQAEKLPSSNEDGAEIARQRRRREFQERLRRAAARRRLRN